MQKFKPVCFFLFFMWVFSAGAQDKAGDKELTGPDTSGKGWGPLFNDSLSNAIFPAGVWVVREVVHASNIEDWIPHSVEIQIADDWSEKWSKVEPSWQCAAIFGHQPATKHIVKKPGEWNHYTITCKGRMIWVALNGQLVNTCDMSLYTSAKDNGA